MSGTAEAEQTQENKHRILAFDIGIKNLAYCLLERTAGGKAEILSWQNVNLLNEGKEVAKAAKVKCNSCSVGASYAIMHCGDTGLEGKGSYCQRHIPASAPALIDASGTVLKTVPALKVLKESAARLSLGKPQGKAAQTRDGWLALFSDKYSLPLKAFAKKAAPNTMHVGLEALHDGILDMIFDDSRYDLLLSANQVLLENQPVLKNPTMKSVQVLLFASLRDAFKAEHGKAPRFHLVHAGKKVRGAAAGDAGYAARKEGGEIRVREWLEKNAAGSKWLEHFLTAAKKSDLSDALCMCLDAVGDAS